MCLSYVSLSCSGIFYTTGMSFLCKQIAGDMLCADQNFDIAQVIRFFRSKVSFARMQMYTKNSWNLIWDQDVHHTCDEHPDHRMCVLC